ncbi:MAG: hypothetical protein HZA22_04470 [Nitrospirae bacterium]|nr:hypothetical protein [Nitrospirota bacterium]
MNTKKPKATKTLLDFMGVVKAPRKPKDWEEVRKKAREYVAKKVTSKK